MRAYPTLYLPDVAPCDFSCFINWKLIARVRYKDTLDIKRKAMAQRQIIVNGKFQFKTRCNKHAEYQQDYFE